MSSWFDGYAKRAARSEASASSEGFTRRQALIGGAVATGVMWTAPALLSATPAWAAVSCASGTDRCEAGFVAGTVDGSGRGCCAVGSTCQSGTCIVNGTVGGTCLNEGKGAGGCISSSTKCNNRTPNICGGPGSFCVTDADCSGGRLCLDNPKLGGPPDKTCGGV